MTTEMTRRGLLAALGATLAAGAVGGSATEASAQPYPPPPGGWGHRPPPRWGYGPPPPRWGYGPPPPRWGYGPPPPPPRCWWGWDDWGRRVRYCR